MRYPWGIRVLGTLLGLAYTLSASPDVPSDNATLTYEYVVVGSGAGGGPVAARLALAGHSVLLIEAGDDQGGNLNYTVPAFEAKVTEDPELAWDFYVRHYEDDARQRLDYKLTYDTQDGGLYTGLDPPAGAKIKGVLYPRAATLGGCTAHNALVAIYPDRDDFQYIADLTGDTSWNPDNIRQYFVKMENNKYLPPAQTGHGYNGWLGIETAPITLALGDTTLLGQLLGGAAALSNLTGLVINLASLLTGDANSAAPTRDSTPTLYQIPISSFNGTRNGAREFVLSVANARNADGSKMYPLDVRLNTFVTKVNLDTSGPTPKATGVSFMDGKYLYRASKRAASAAPGTSGTVTATREVIVSGGTYNSPQILKLSGIGPAAELESFGVPVVKDLPGVGTNLQDHYEVVVQGQQANNFSVLNGCSFGFWEPDNCLQQWQTSGILPGNNRGTYASSGFAGSLFFKSSSTPDGNYDEFLFGGPVNFRGYFPGYSVNATIEHNWWSWAMLKSHPRNRAGTVKLNSSDPLDPPNISFNYFDAGSGDYEADVNTIIESIDLARAAFRNQTTAFTEILPGAEVQSRADLEAYIKNTAWGHHASCTCPIGADNDPMAVLDSSFRVRGVSGLRVVDASVYPKIPGTFTALSTYLVGEKAADVILSQLAASG